LSIIRATAIGLSSRLVSYGVEEDDMGRRDPDHRPEVPIRRNRHMVRPYHAAPLALSGELSARPLHQFVLVREGGGC
jgi:hypothetical protein